MANPNDFVDIYDILSRTNSLPSVNVRPLAQGTQAEFDPSIGQTGQISFNTANPVPSTRALTHEYTHALDNVMGNIWNKIHDKMQNAPHLLTPEERAFYSAYKKLEPFDTRLPRRLADPYRSQSAELRAFGTGNLAEPGKTDYAIPHTDATMAQEAAILRDLFKRTLK